MKKKNIAACLLLLLVFGLIGGYHICSNNSEAERLEPLKSEILNAPEVTECSICKYTGKHAPCLVNLSTGEIGELQVYHPHNFEGENISLEWDGGTFSFVHVAGLTGHRDSWSQTCYCDVPENDDIMDLGYFCKSCREKIVQQTVSGYIIVDCKEAANVEFYAIEDGAEYAIRGYDVTVDYNRKQKEFEVANTGHYMDGLIPHE